MSPPRAFVSYAWEPSTRVWVKTLATRLRKDGVNVVLDQWEVVPGDMLPSFMESQVRDSDFVLIICTPKYKEKSETRIGGVGFEGHVMTGEFFTGTNSRKFIPLLRGGSWKGSAPSWLAGSYYVDMSSDPIDESSYEDLLTALHRQREVAPPIGVSPKSKIEIGPRDEKNSGRDDKRRRMGTPVGQSARIGSINNRKAAASQVSEGERQVLGIIKGWGGCISKDTIVNGPDGSPDHDSNLQRLLVKGLVTAEPTDDSNPLFWRYRITEQGEGVLTPQDRKQIDSY